MTNHFFPLSEDDKFEFFDGIRFDNPQNMDEINAIANVLKDANYMCKRPFPEETHQVGEGYMTLRSILEDFINNHVNEYERRKIKFTKNVYKDLAKMWVVIRFEDTIIETSENHKKVSQEFEDSTVFPLNGAVFQSMNFVKSRIAFLDFICNDSILTSIIFKDELEITFHSQMRLFPELIVRSHKNNKTETKSPSQFYPFNKVIDYYRPIINLIGTRYKTDKFEYLCDSLQSMKSIYFINRDLFNMQMVSLVEFLLTHKPDYNRFNVEDSITKQFVGKLNLVLYEYYSKYSKSIEKELKLAYSIRSDIAHGDFVDKKKQLDKLAKLYDTKTSESATIEDLHDEVMITLNGNIELYVRVLIELYLNDEEKLVIFQYNEGIVKH